MGKTKANGRPPKYKCKEEIIGLIEDYFKSCEGTPLYDKNGDPVYDKFGYPVIINRRPPTITGLSLALGFTSRQALLNYQGRAEFHNVITQAKSRVEQYTEERLFDKDGANGAKFSLQFNFKGWREEKSEETQAPVVNIVCDIPRDVPGNATPAQIDNATDMSTVDVNEIIKNLESGASSGVIENADSDSGQPETI